MKEYKVYFEGFFFCAAESVEEAEKRIPEIPDTKETWSATTWVTGYDHCHIGELDDILYTKNERGKQ